MECLHCQEKIRTDKLLCSFCSEQIEFVQLEGRCPRCLTTASCSCSFPSHSIGAAVEAQGSVLSLIQARHGSAADEIAKTMAAFLVLALDRQKWSTPTVIVPVPTDPFNIKLARYLALFLEMPLKNIFLKNKWIPSACVSDECVLLIDTLVRPEEGLFCLLEEGAPSKVLYLAFGVV